MSSNSKELEEAITGVINEQRSIYSDITNDDIKEALKQLLTEY